MKQRTNGGEAVSRGGWEADVSSHASNGSKWMNTILGIVVLLFSGIIYGWSVLSVPIAAEFSQASSSSLSLTFTLSMISFCLAGLISGMTAGKLSVRMRMILAAILFGVGFMIAAQAQSLGLLYLGYGLLCGAGAGFSYNSVITTVSRWYPGQQGFISGLLLMGFGASSLIIGSAYTAWTPEELGSWRGSFRIIGILMVIIMLLGALILRAPEVEKTQQSSVRAKETAGPAVTPYQMIRKPSFWLFFVWEILITAVGLSVISQAKMITTSVSPEMKMSLIAFLAGLISVFNGLGRIFFGALFDKLQWKKTMWVVNISSILGSVCLLVALMTSSVILLIVGFLITGIAYGGAPTMCAAFTRECYGAKHYAVNFQIALLNLLPASFAGTLTGRFYDMSGSFVSTFILLIACGAVSIPLLMGIRGEK